MKMFETDINIERVLDYALLACMAARCAIDVHNGNWGDALVLLSCGIVFLLRMYQLDVAGEVIEHYHDEGEDFIKATRDKNGGVYVIAGGEQSSVTECCAATLKFMGKFVAQEYESADDAAKHFNESFVDAVEMYCEIKGMDRDEFYKLVGLNKLD